MFKKVHLALIGTAALASCSFGPRFHAAMPQIRDVPVLAGLSPADSFARARGFLAARQYGLAIELYKTASRDPALAADSLNGLAVAYDGIGRRDLAERYFQRALAARPSDPRTRRNLAAFYAASGQVDKQRALLADAATPPSDAIPSPAGLAAIGALESAALAGAGAMPVRALESQSPLGGLFRPLLVPAGLPPSAAPAASVGPGAREAGPDATIVCASNAATPAKTAAGEAMHMFRISIGEVFITPQPAGTVCYVEGGAAGGPGAAEPPMSNKEYLGLVAAYLDRLNTIGPVADISATWRAAFWPWNDQA